MTALKTSHLLPLALIALLMPLGAQQANNEEFARRQYESGLSFMQNRRYGDALKDLQAVADSFSDSTVADNALLEIATYQLEIARDTVATQQAVDRLLKDFASSDAAPMAHVISGRLAMAKGRAPADVDSAMASFERVTRLFPGTEGVAAAGYYAGETLRVVRRVDEALDRYRRIRTEYPRSIWAARAAIGAGYCLVTQGNPQHALQEIQWVRQQFPNTAAAAEALNLNTIIYRLYVRTPAQPPYTFTGKFIGAERANYQDIIGLQFQPDGRLMLGHKGGIAVFDDKGAVATTIAAQSPSTFFVDDKNRVVVARGSNLIADKGDTLQVFMPDKDGKVRYVEDIPAGLVNGKGERILSDAGDHRVIRLAADGKYLGQYAQVEATRVTMNGLEDIAMLDKSTKGIFISDRDSKAVSKILPKGTGWQFEDPIDIAFDSLDQLYVLDRGTGTVFVFSPKSKLITTLAIPEKSPGAFNKALAFSLDRAGRMYIYDERAKRIQVYQ